MVLPRCCQRRVCPRVFRDHGGRGLDPVSRYLLAHQRCAGPESPHRRNKKWVLLARATLNPSSRKWGSGGRKEQGRDAQSGPVSLGECPRRKLGFLLQGADHCDMDPSYGIGRIDIIDHQHGAFRPVSAGRVFFGGSVPPATCSEKCGRTQAEEDGGGRFGNH